MATIYLWKTTNDNHVKSMWLKNKKLSQKHYFLANVCYTETPTRTSNNAKVKFYYLINQLFLEETDYDSVLAYKEANKLSQLEIFCIQYLGGSRQINKVTENI